MIPARTVRPIPLYDDHGRMLRVVKPRSRCFLVSEHDGSGPGVPRRERAMVRFVDDFASGNSWDVDRAALSVSGD